MTRNKKVVVIGGGTGTFVVLSGLKQYPLDISAIITMMDSGGSTGKLRDQYGVLPPGDARQALVALSECSQEWRKLFLYRFEDGDLEGHNFGNLFLTALEKVTGNFNQALALAQQLLKTKGNVIPITLHKTHIVAELENGSIIKHEAYIDKREKHSPIKKLFLEKNVPVNPTALTVLSEADVIIVGPGDVFTSVLCNFTFPEVISAFRKSNAKKVFIMNLMNSTGQADNFSTSSYLNVFSSFLGKNPFNTIICNDAPIPKALKEYYRVHGEEEIWDDLPTSTHYTVVRKDLLSSQIVRKLKSDTASHGLVRHDELKLAHCIFTEVLQ